MNCVEKCLHYVRTGSGTVGRSFVGRSENADYENRDQVDVTATQNFRYFRCSEKETREWKVIERKRRALKLILDRYDVATNK